MNNASFNITIRGEDGGFDVGGLENLMDIAGDDGFAGGAGDADKFE